MALAQIENPSQVMLEGPADLAIQRYLRGLRDGRHPRPVLSESTGACATKTGVSQPTGATAQRRLTITACTCCWRCWKSARGITSRSQDVYVNIIGGLKLDETACDLPVCIAMASSLLDLPVGEKTIAIGEVGLGGEVRSVTHLETRLREAQRVGFDTAIVPKHNLKMIDPAQFPDLKLVGVSYLREAINTIKLK